MVDTVTARIWTFSFLYLGAVCIVAFVYLLPNQYHSRYWVAPDLILCLTYAWVLRRPDILPILLIASVGFLTDLLFQRPPGLLAALMVLGSEFLRSRATFMRDTPFVGEWSTATIVIFFTLIVHKLVLSLLLVPSPSLGLVLLHAVITAACYPLVVALSRWLFGISRIQHDHDLRKRA